MYAIVDFDTNTAQFFSSFDAASAAITAYTGDNVVIIDNSGKYPQAEKL
jgi:hypothetical protein